MAIQAMQETNTITSIKAMKILINIKKNSSKTMENAS